MAQRMARVASGGALLSLLAAGVAHAEAETARGWFEIGVEHFHEGACDKSPVASVPACAAARDAFRRAFALEPTGLGALRNLAIVEKNLGLHASAREHFLELARRAPLDPSPARRAWAEYAKAEAGALAPLVPRLVVALEGPWPAGVTLRVDGALADVTAATTSGLELDPGDVVVVATAGTTRVEAKATLVAGVTTRVRLANVQAATPHVTPVPPTAPPGDRPSRSWTPPLVAALGAVTTIVGLGFGYAAWHKKDRYCDENGACDPQQLERAHDLARTSNFVTAAGAAVLAGGCIWWAIDRSRTVTTSAALSPGAAFVLTRVAF